MPDSVTIEGGGVLDDFNVAMTLHVEYKQVNCKKTKKNKNKKNYKQQNL